MIKNVRHINLDDLYDICECLEDDNGLTLSWSKGMMGCDYSDGEALTFNRMLLEKINRILNNQELSDNLKTTTDK